MQLEFNGEPIETTEALSLFELLRQYELDTRKGIAVAVDNQVIPRLHWSETILNEGRKIAVFTAAQGG